MSDSEGVGLKHFPNLIDFMWNDPGIFFEEPSTCPDVLQTLKTGSWIQSPLTQSPSNFVLFFNDLLSCYFLNKNKTIIK